MSKKAGRQQQPAQKAGASRFLPLVIIGITLVTGVILGRWTSGDAANAVGNTAGSVAEARPAAQPQPSPQAKPAAAAADDATTIARIEIDTAGAPFLGQQDAPITVVEFIDYQCPFCKRSHATVDQVVAKYGDKVRIVFMQNPLSFHADAPLASQAALAAAKQGRFAEMHQVLLANQKALKRESLTTYAQSLGLDMAAFEADMDSPESTARVQKDQALAARVGAVATPWFFVNGRSVRGAQPIGAFEKIIDEELAGNLKPTRWIARVETPKRQGPPPEDPNKVYKIDTANSVTMGPEDAPVTMVEFTAFRCGYCARAQSTVQQVLDTYPDSVKLVVKNMPLGEHDAAIASLAADRQGKYWEFRKALFVNRGALNSPGQMAVIAQQIGLDVGQFESDRNDPELAALVKRDIKQAGEIGVRGTPTFFINGKKMVGAQPFASFQTQIDAQLGGGQAAARGASR